MKITNNSQRKLNFKTAFYIDGDERKAMYKYVMVQDEDPESADYGVISMQRTDADDETVPGTTMLSPETPDEDDSMWQLDISQLPKRMFWKIRLPVSGKGYAPRLLLVTTNEKPYDLLNISWISRQLNSR